MATRQGFDVILHARTSAPSGTCEGFTGVPVAQPAWIVLLSEGSPEGDAAVRALAAALRTALLGLDTSVSQPSVPCGGARPDVSCHAEGEPDCSKLLVWLGDRGPQSRSLGELLSWGSHPDRHVLPVLPRSADANAVLPASLRPLNAATWNSDAAEVAPQVLISSGVVPEERRAFISYRRLETQAMADQLFDGLSRVGFDVFLDRFRLPPGIDFAARLTEELADMAMVVLLESPDVNKSTWVGLEAGFARKHRLGLIAVHPPQASPVPGLAHRLTLAPSEVTGLFPYQSGPAPLTAPAMERIVAAVLQEHARALAIRRKLLRESLALALAKEGITDPDVSYPAFGVRVDTPAGGHGIGLSVRPARVGDFYTVDSSRRTLAEKGWLVSPLAGLQASRRDRIDWLADKADVGHLDEGDLVRLAVRIASGGP